MVMNPGCWHNLNTLCVFRLDHLGTLRLPISTSFCFYMKARVTTAQALRIFSGLERRIVERVSAAEALTLADAKEEALDASSGTISTAELRRRDHPYAVRHGTAKEDPEVINEQEGRFKRRWQTRRPIKTGTRLEGRLRNTDPKAKHMHGTDVMLPRPIIRRVSRRIKPMRRVRVQRALWSALLFP